MDRDDRWTKDPGISSGSPFTVNMAGLTYPLARIIGLMLASLFYGIHLITFFVCVRVVLWPKTEPGPKSLKRINFAMLIPTFIIFAFATCDIVYGVFQNVDLFIGPLAHPSARFLLNIKMVDFLVQIFFGDGVLIYRNWVIYDRRPLIVGFPILIWTGSAVCSAMTCFKRTMLVRHGGSITDSAVLRPYITAVLSLTMATNVITTSLIVYRIWSVRNLAVRPLPGRERLSRVNRVLIESGLVYTTAIGLMFGFFLASNNAVYPTCDSVVQITGITFNSIIIRGERDDSAVDSESQNTSKARTNPGQDISLISRGPSVRTSSSPRPSQEGKSPVTWAYNRSAPRISTAPTVTSQD